MQARFKYRYFFDDKLYDVLGANFESGYITVRRNGEIVTIMIKPEKIVQSTGLTDKNGKLIYEGDIVRYAEVEFEENTEWEIAEVIWGGDYHYPAFDLKNKDFDGMNALSYLFGDGWTIEVIGNIYENPELLGDIK